jgi:KipI family sensor histidine kinase inhibitor
LTLPLEPFGPNALRLALEDAWGEDFGGRAALARSLLTLPGVRDALVTEGHALVLLDPRTHARDLASAIPALLTRCAGATTHARRVEIDVHYDGADLDEIAAALATTRAEVIARHTERPLTVSFLGFLPGFAYLRGLDEGLAGLPRRSSPRARVDAGSVAIAGGMGAVYPSASPGGWNLVGHAPCFDPVETALAVGDEVRFRVACATAPRSRSRAPAPPLESRDAVLVTRVAGPALVVDGAPRRRLALGTPPGGPLAPSRAARASHAAGNPVGSALLERFGPITLALSPEARAPRTVADEDRRRVRLSPGEEVSFGWSRERRVGYVAIEGGVAVPEVLGGLGTILSLGRGGHEGRALRRGDRLALGEERAGTATAPTASPDPDAPLVMERGPDLLDLEAASTTIALARFRIAAASDRTGIRLEGLGPGTSLATRASRTAPMRAGAVQAPPSGELVVLGPDHPVTGGYPVIGILAPSALESLAVRSLGSEVRLRLARDA